MAQIESLLPLQQLDPLFKLFGRTISVGSCLSGDRLDTCGKDVSQEKSASDVDVNCTISSPFKQIMAAEETGNIMCMPEEVGSCSSSSDMSDEETQEQERNNELAVPGAESKVNKESGLKNQSQSNALAAPDMVNKRSDKPLPCPRCSSLNTKFCYFNNYNVKQPRHFCKQCQRYWTAGGSLRNVPFGAGRRKNKQTGSTQLASSDSTPVIGDSTQQLLYTVGSRTGVLKVAYSASQPINRVGTSSPSKDPASGAILSRGEKKNICETLVTTATNLHRTGQLGSQISQVVDLQNKGATINKKCLRDQDEIGRKEAIEKISQVEKSCGATDKVPTVLQSVNGQALGCLQPAMCIKKGAHTAESKMDLGISSDPISAQMIPSWSNGLPLVWIGGSGINVYNVDHNTAIATTSLPSTAIGNESSGNLMQAPSNPFLLNGAPGAMWMYPYGPLLQSSLWNLVEWNMPWGGAAARTSGADLTVAPATKPSLDQTRLLGKHSREKLCSELKTEGLLLAPKAMKLDELNVATRESLWIGLGLENKPESIKDNQGL